LVVSLIVAVPFSLSLVVVHFDRTSATNGSVAAGSVGQDSTRYVTCVTEVAGRDLTFPS